MSVQVTYDPNAVTFKTSFLCGQLNAQKDNVVYEFSLPPGRIQDKMKYFERQKISFSLFDYVYYEGPSLDVYYIGFSNESLGMKSSE